MTAVTSGMLGGIRAALHTLDELKYATDYRLSLDECSGRSFSPSEPVSADIIDLECMASKTIRTAIRWFHIVPPHGASPRELATTLSNIPDFDELLPPAIMSELACLYAALAAYLAHTKHEAGQVMFMTERNCSRFLLKAGVQVGEAEVRDYGTPHDTPAGTLYNVTEVAKNALQAREN